MITEFEEFSDFEPVFKTEKDYNDFRESFSNEVTPILEEYRIARIKSIEDSMRRIVG